MSRNFLIIFIYIKEESLWQFIYRIISVGIKKVIVSGGSLHTLPLVFAAVLLLRFVCRTTAVTLERIQNQFLTRDATA